jgi:uncharacterized phage protein (TIGR01671 family)
MKREIKFRAWDLDAKDKMYHWEEISRTFIEHLNHPRVAVMQFTGLRDKNGNEIYEGDILAFLYGENTSTENGFDWNEQISIGQVYWESERMGWSVTNQVMTDESSVWEDIEIIGNIYENPELL